MGVAGGPLGALLALIVSTLLGSMLERGLIVVDIQIDRLKEALKDPQWKAAAQKAYQKASAKVYTEEEKRAIRDQYRNALRNYATYGNGMPNNPKR